MPCRKEKEQRFQLDTEECEKVKRITTNNKETPGSPAVFIAAYSGMHPIPSRAFRSSKSRGSPVSTRSDLH